MSTQSVLFDIPGPRAVRRHRTLGALGVLLLSALLAAVVYGLRDQLTGPLWAPFLAADTWIYYVYPGVFMTLQAALISVVLATLLGLVLGMGRLSHVRPVRWAASIFVEFFRSVPVLMMMLFAYYVFLFTIRLPGALLPILGVVIGLTLYNACVMAELLRSGVHSLPKGQREAGLAIGLSPGQTLRSILLPQAVTAMLPSLVSQLVVILKDTALGYLITYPDLIRSMTNLSAVKGNLVTSFLVAAVIFILINSLLTTLAHWIERRVAGRRAGPGAVALPNLATDPDEEYADAR
ncbi:MAG: amino acid ABC transporter permease [Propionibacteriaceae bacterium]